MPVESVSGTTLHCCWKEFKEAGVLLSNPALCYHFSSLTSFILKQLFPWFTAIHTYVIRNILCHILSLPGYKSTCVDVDVGWGCSALHQTWPEAKREGNVSTSASNKCTRWRWWLKAVTNIVLDSDVAILGCFCVIFVTHFFTKFLW